MDAPAAKPGVHALLDMPPPKGWNHERWFNFAADAVSFRMKWGKVAIDLGWTPGDLFSVSRSRPDRPNYWGALLFVNGRKIVEVTSEHIAFETSADELDPDTGEVTKEANILRARKRAPAHDTCYAWDLKNDT